MTTVPSFPCSDRNVIEQSNSLRSKSNNVELTAPTFPAISAIGTRSTVRTARSNPFVGFSWRPALRKDRISSSSRFRSILLSSSRFRSFLRIVTGSLVRVTRTSSKFKNRKLSLNYLQNAAKNVQNLPFLALSVRVNPNLFHESLLPPLQFVAFQPDELHPIDWSKLKTRTIPLEGTIC